MKIDTEWKREWFSSLRFPSSYWKSLENRKMFLDEISKEFDIKNPSDCGKIPQQRIYDLGGSTLLLNYYGASLFNCLQSIYPGLIYLFSFTIHYPKKQIGKKEWFIHSYSDWKSI